MTKNYHLQNIRTLLMKGFSDRELRRLCHDILSFRPIYEELVPLISKAKIVDLLLEYAEQKVLLDPLLAWAEECNPTRYDQHQPYYDLDPNTSFVLPIAKTQRFMETNLESAILDALYDYYKSHVSSPEMTFAELYRVIDISSKDTKEVAEIRSKLFFLQKNKWIEYQALTDASGGIIKIASKGIKITEDRRQQASAPTPNLERFESQEEDVDKITTVNIKIDTLESCPVDLDELAQRDQDYAYLIQRDQFLHELKKNFTQTSKNCHFIILYGQPMVGKTKILVRLSEILDDGYVPLIVTGQGLHNALRNLDNFAFDLADQLTTKFNNRVKRYGKGLNPPEQNNFEGGKGRREFYRHWKKLRQRAGENQPVVMFDEIEHLLDYPEELDPQILTFLDDFVRDPDNGYFILAGSERIRYSNNRQFYELIAKAQEFIRVGHYDEGTTTSIFSALRKYFTCEDDALQYCAALCDGHPRLLRFVFKATVDRVIKSTGKKGLEKSDIEPILTTVIEQTADLLWMLKERLSIDERLVVWLISQKVTSLINDLECSLDELVDLAHQHLSTAPVDRDNLSRGVVYLEAREWLEWKDRATGLFRFKLGIFPLWIRHLYINLDEVKR